MATILALSSQVVRGHVGLSAIVPALQRMGHVVLAMPTILLSNHPGHAETAGARTDPAVLEQMFAALAGNGWLPEIDAVVSGYLPSAEHVHLASRIVRRLKTGRRVLYVCDPVLGDEPKGVYIDAHAAAAIRNELLLLADIATPNRFELGWLAGQPTTSPADIVAAARSLACSEVVVTSAALLDGKLLNIHVTGERAEQCAVTAVEAAPHGTGDLFAGLLAGHMLDGHSSGDAMGRAAQGVAVALAASAGRDELDLSTTLGAIVTALPLRRAAL